MGGSPSARGWTQNVATGMYAVASASGSIFFAVNFGDEGMFHEAIILFQSRKRTDLSRRRSCHLLGLSSMHYPRHTTNLRCRIVVLGLAIDQIHRDGRIGQLCRCCQHESHHPCRRHHSMLDVGCWHRPLHRPTQILSPSPRQNALILHVPLPPQNHPRKPRSQTFITSIPKLY